MNKRIISIILALCMTLSCVAVGSFAVNAAAVSAETEAVGSGSQDAQSTIQGSAILHCFDWSYNSIKNNMKAIADAGYTAVQTSPVQPSKDYSSSWMDQQGQWWKLYQPIGVYIADGSNSWLGTKSELKAMCAEADKYGIKVVVDIVANHMADNGLKRNGFDNVSSQVESSMRNSEYWRSEDVHADNDNDRYHVTHGAIDLPDLNTGNSYVQSRFKQLLADCVSCGVDGFRFDAAKHIELPGENGGSNFWPTVLAGAPNAFVYGEILNYAGTDIGNYTKYMSITDNYSGDRALVAANNSDAQGLANSNYAKGAAANKSVIWCESHDTYMGGSGSAGLGNTKSVSNDKIVKCWAIVGSRADSTALFFARPASNMGAASTDTTYKSKAVAEVNKFKNYFDGEGEYLSSESGCAYNERGTTGVVISRLSGGGSVSLTAHKMKAGTYKDQVSGNTFTVSGGKISGTVGSTGVAVVYNAAPPGPSASVTPDSGTFKTDTYQLTLSYTNATSGQYSVDGGAYQNFTNGQTITIGSGKAYDSVITVKVKASDGSTTSDEKTYTYTKVDPTKAQYVYFDNSSYNWSSVYAYIYANEVGMTAWPGTKMQYDSSTGYYALEVPEAYSDGLVIFTESETATDNRYPADQEPGLPLEGKTKLFKANHQLVDYSGGGTTPTTPTTQPVTTPSGSILIGDTNLDGAITISDATEIQKHIARLGTLTGDALTAADCNGDTAVDITDVTNIQSYLVRLTGQSAKVGQYTGGGSIQQPTTPVTPTTPVNPTTPVDDGNYIYYYNAGGWDKVTAYFWNEGGEMAWPGNEMTSVGNNVYRAEIPSGMVHIIFSNAGGNQTPDLDIPGAGYIYRDGGWSQYSGGGTVIVNPTNPVSDGNYVYYRDNNGWGNVNAYFWNQGGEMEWPGSSMESIGNNVYRAEIPSGMVHIIFSNGGNNQTGDLDLPGAGYIYDNGNWSAYSG